jgi:hypothetical protein
MATTDLSQLNQRWSQRFAQLQGQGVDPGKAQAVYQQDVNKVSQGGTPMSGLEAKVQIMAAYGVPQVSETPKSKGGFLGGLESAVGNIPADIGSFVRNIPKMPVGLAKLFGHDVTHIGEVPGDLGKAVSQAGQGDFGGAIQTLSKTPGMQTLLPIATETAGTLLDATGIGAAIGVPLNVLGAGLAGAELATAPAALATTPEGRKELEQHPISEGVLQVLPMAKFGGEIAAEPFAKIAGALKPESFSSGEEAMSKALAIKEAKQAGTYEAPLSNAAKAKLGLPDAPSELSKLESIYTAMKGGHPVVAGYRTLIPKAAQDFAAARALEFTRSLGIDDFTRQLSRGVSQVTRSMQEHRNILLKNAEAFFKDKTPEEVTDFFRKASDPKNYPNMSPEERVLFHHAKEIERSLKDQGADKLFAVSMGDKEVVFPGQGRESEAPKLWAETEKAQKTLQAARVEFQRTTAIVEKEKARIEAAIARQKNLADYWGNFETREKTVKPSRIAPGVTDPGKWSKAGGNWFVSESGRSIVRAEQGLYVLFDEHNRILGQFESMADARTAAQRMVHPGPGAEEFNLVKSGKWKVPEEWRSQGLTSREELGPYTISREGRGRHVLRNDGNYVSVFKTNEAAKKFVAGLHGEDAKVDTRPPEPKEPHAAEVARQARAKDIQRAEDEYHRLKQRHQEAKKAAADVQHAGLKNIDWSQADRRDLPARELKPGMQILVDPITGRPMRGDAGRAVISRVEKIGRGSYDVWYVDNFGEHRAGVSVGHAKKFIVNVPSETVAATADPMAVADARLQEQIAWTDSQIAHERLQKLRNRPVEAEHYPALVHNRQVGELQVGDRVWTGDVPETNGWRSVDEVVRRPDGKVDVAFEDGHRWEGFDADQQTRAARHIENSPEQFRVQTGAEYLKAATGASGARALITKTEEGRYRVQWMSGDDGVWQPATEDIWKAAMLDAHNATGVDAYSYAAEHLAERGDGVEKTPEPPAPSRTTTPIPELGPAKRKLVGKTARRYTAATDKLSALREELRTVSERGSHERAANAYMRAKEGSEKANQAWLRHLIDNAPAQYHPMLEAELRDRATAKLQGKFDAGKMTGPELEKALDYIKRGDAGPYFSDKEWTQLRQEVRRGWLSLVGAGYDPLWVHTVSTARFGTAFATNMFSDHFWTPTQVKAKVFDLTPRVESVGVALSSASLEYAREGAIRETVQRYIMPAATDTQGMRDILEPQYRAALAQAKGLESEALVWQRVRDENFVQFDPEKFGLKRPTGRGMKDADVWVPKHVSDAFEKVTEPHRQSAIGKVSTRATGFLKANLFFLSPRHFSHVVFGGGLAMMLTGDWREVTSAVQAWKMAKEGRSMGQVLKGEVASEEAKVAATAKGVRSYPEEMSRGIDTVSTDQIMHYAAGRWAGSRLMKLQAGVGHIEEFLSNVERSMSMLGEEKRGLAKGYTAEHARELAIEHVHKTFVDWDGMLPIERTVIRQWLPFYGFTKYIVRFLLSFPADHPIRAAIMAHIAENENKDWKNGLPQDMQKLFFIGTPDSNGNVSVSDIKSINPFRDAGNLFSVWGLVGQLHPAAQEVLKGMGINTLGGTPELYPQLDIDPITGRIVAQRPGISAMGVVESFMPWTGSLDSWFGLTQQARLLKASNPTAYRQHVFSSLGIPFVPYKVNVAQEMARAEKDRYLVAQQAVSEAEKSGDTSTIRQMAQVPWKSHLVSGAALADLLDWYTAHYPGQKPISVMPHTRTA